MDKPPLDLKSGDWTAGAFLQRMAIRLRVAESRGATTINLGPWEYNFLQVIAGNGCVEISRELPYSADWVLNLCRMAQDRLRQPDPAPTEGWDEDPLGD